MVLGADGDGAKVHETVGGQFADHEVQVLLGEGDGTLADFIHTHDKGEGNGILQHTGGLQHIEHVLDGGGLEALQLRLNAHVLHHAGILDQEVAEPLVNKGAARPGGGDQGAVQRAHLGFDQLGVVEQFHAILGAGAGAVGGGGGVLEHQVALGPDAGADLAVNLGVVGGQALLVSGVDVDNGGARIVAVICGVGDLLGSQRNIGVGLLTVEGTGLGYGDDNLFSHNILLLFSFFAGLELPLPPTRLPVHSIRPSLPATPVPAFWPAAANLRCYRDFFFAIFSHTGKSTYFS